MTAYSWIRASDRDRERATDVLSEGYAVGRLTREELEERTAAAYSARTWGELGELTADLPGRAAGAGLRCPAVGAGPARLAVGAGLRPGIAGPHGAPPTARPRLAGRMLWIVVLVVAAGLAGLVTPVTVWIATVIIPVALLLPPALGICTHYGARAGTCPRCEQESCRRRA